MKYYLIILAFGITSCAAAQLNPGAERIRVLTEDPKGCKFLGEVAGNQGNWASGAWTSNKNLERGARNKMKNEAQRLGANVVAMQTNRAGVTGNRGGSSSQTNVTNIGNAYWCPASANNAANNASSSDGSTVKTLIRTMVLSSFDCISHRFRTFAATRPIVRIREVV